MAISFEQFITKYAGKLVAIPGLNYKPGVTPYQCVSLFWAFNREVGHREAYSAPGAFNLWTAENGQPMIWADYARVTSGYRYGDVLIWSGTSGSYPNSGYGHVALALGPVQGGTVQVLTQNPGPVQVATLSADGIVGALRPKFAVGSPAARPDLAPTAASALRKVTQNVAWARTAPNASAPLAPGFPKGIAKGANLAVVGYVAGQDPFKTGDNAWYKTRSGFYVWANAAENRIEGLKYLGKL